jgi:hypothetical protein
MALDSTNEVFAGGRVLIESTITDLLTGLAPNPYPDSVTVHVYKPDVSGAQAYVEDGTGTPMTDGGGGNFSVSYPVPTDGPPGAWKTQVAMHFPDGSTDLALPQTSFWVTNQI